MRNIFLYHINFSYKLNRLPTLDFSPNLFSQRFCIIQINCVFFSLIAQLSSSARDSSACLQASKALGLVLQHRVSLVHNHGHITKQLVLGIVLYKPCMLQGGLLLKRQILNFKLTPPFPQHGAHTLFKANITFQKPYALKEKAFFVSQLGLYL